MNLEDILIRHDEHIRLCLKSCWGTQDYDDTKQEVIEKIIMKWKTIQNPLATKLWISQLIKNHLIDKSRKRKSRLGIEISMPEYEDDLANLFVDYQNPETELLNKEFCIKVLETCRQLPMTMRTMLKDRFYRQMDYKQIAEKHNVPVGTVKSRISRGRDVVKEGIADARQ